jgi:thioredoxin 1
MCLASLFANSVIFGDDLPAVFDKRSYDEAKIAAAEGKKWFIVMASSEWCMPCKQMNKTTWRDEKVVAWLQDNSIMIEIDVDVEKKLAKDLKIDTMSTFIAFRNADQEFDRIVGYRNPSDFLLWVERMARGEKSIDAILKLAGERDGSKGKVEIRARLNLARSFQQSGKANEAADEYAWLWQYMLEHDRGYFGVHNRAC